MPELNTSAIPFASCCAGIYELPLTRLLLGDSFHPGGLTLSKRLAELAMVGPDRRVLDLASGAGGTAALLADHFGARVVGLDYSSRNVLAGAEEARRRGLSERLEFVCGDAHELPFEADSFDAVLSECALCTFDDAGGVAEEIRRVLRPGARVAISDVTLSGPVPAALDDVFGRVICIAGARSPARYREIFTDAGFERVRYRDASWAVTEMIDRIRRAIRRIETLARLGQERWPEELEGSYALLDEAARASREGALGYGIFTAVAP